MAFARLALFLFYALTAFGVHAESLEALFQKGIDARKNSAQSAQARKTLEEKLTSTRVADIHEFYSRQEAAAYTLGDYAKAMEVTQTWLSAVPENEKNWPRMELWGTSWYYGTLEDGIKQGIVVLDRETNSTTKDLMSIDLAYQYIDSYQFSAAEAVLGRIEESVKKNGNSNCSVLRTKVRLQREKARLLLLTGKPNKAINELDVGLAIKSVVDVCKADHNRLQQMLGILNYAGLLRVKAQALLALNRIDEAELLVRDALVMSIDHVLDPEQEIAQLESFTGLFAAKGDWQNALHFARLYQQSGQLNAEQVNVPVLSALTFQTNALIGLGKWQEALDLQTSTDAMIGSRANLHAVWRNAQIRALLFLKAGSPDKAVAMGKEAYEAQKTRTGPNHYLTGQAAGVYAMSLYAAGDRDAARKLFNMAFAGLVSPQGVVTGAENVGINKVYNQLILRDYLRFLESEYQGGDQAAANMAFQVAELMRGSTVQLSIVEAAARSAANVAGLGELVRTEQDGKNQLSALYDVLNRKLDDERVRIAPEFIAQTRTYVTELEAELKKLNTRISKEFPDYANLVTPQPAGLQEVAKKLTKDEALVSLLVTPERSYAWSVTADRPPQWIGIDISQVEVDALVGNLRKTLDLSEQLNRGTLKGFDTASSYALYQKFLAPMKTSWQGKGALVVSPSGKLSQIPWGVILTDATPKTVKYADMPWLIKQASISHVPSVSGWMALKGLPTAAGNRKPFIGYGDPSFALASLETAKAAEIKARGKSLNVDIPLVSTLQYNELPPLPETRDEILAVAQALKADKDKDVFLGAKATRANVVNQPLNDRRIISFATHGLVAGDLPQLSQPALAMAGTNNPKESPLLTLEDVMNLKLDADWVVLSACNTASSDGKGDEALSGLGRGFFYSGARSLLATHWSVESESAKDLMTQTFENYGADDTTSRAQALRAAQLKMASGKFGHPFYWSAYALVGDGGR
jgi:CHAT domain-containing protein